MGLKDGSARSQDDNLDGTANGSPAEPQSLNGNREASETTTDDEREVLETVRERLPDVFGPYLETLQPYTSTVLNWWFKPTEEREQLQDKTVTFPVENATVRPIALLVGLYHESVSGTWLELLEREYTQSDGYLDFTRSLLALASDDVGERMSGLLETIDTLKDKNEILRILNETLNREIEERSRPEERDRGTGQRGTTKYLEGIFDVLDRARGWTSDGSNSNGRADSLGEVIDVLRQLSPIHRELGIIAGDETPSVRIDHYIRKIANVSLSGATVKQPESTLNVYAENISLSPDKTPVLGLILHELISDIVLNNSVDGQALHVDIALGAANGVASLSFQNVNGTTVKQGNELDHVRQLVEEDLQGTLELKDEDPGPSRVVTFPVTQNVNSTRGETQNGNWPG